MMYKLFVDLDGVLADFDRGVKDITGKLPGELFVGAMWGAIAKTPDFYANLYWMEDGKVLWDAVKPCSPVILTGLPRGSWAEPQKRSWCARELGQDVPVITCMTRDKAAEAGRLLSDGETPVLVDDRDKTRESWEEAGGIFIHHRSASESIQKLKDLGIILD